MRSVLLFIFAFLACAILAAALPVRNTAISASLERRGADGIDGEVGSSSFEDLGLDAPEDEAPVDEQPADEEPVEDSTEDEEPVDDSTEDDVDQGDAEGDNDEDDGFAAASFDFVESAEDVDGDDVDGEDDADEDDN